MKALVTGASGFIGFHVAKLLQEKGVSVRALVRDGSEKSFLRALDVELVPGDVRDADRVSLAARGCRQIYHVAADYRLWVPDPGEMYETNVQGTVNVMRAAQAMDVERVVYTSSAGTLVSRKSGWGPFSEETQVCFADMVGHYKRSKFLAEREVCQFVRQGLPVVIVNPTTPVGAGDRKPTPTGKIIVDFLNGRMPAFIETGLNFVDVEEVAHGHWLAACHGRVGEKYILGDRNIGLRQFFQILAQASGCKAPRVKLPYLPVLCAAYVDEALCSWVTRKAPRIPVTGVRMAREHMYFDCSKARRELSMGQAGIEKAVERAIDWYRTEGYVGGRPFGGRHA
jgi:dihydroflavonol-4-reductase